MTQTSDPVVIAALARTPMGGFQGVLSGARATDLGAAAVRAAVARAGVDPGAVEQIYMGCVLPGGLGQAPARQAALGAGLSESCQATTVNKMCGSGMQAAILAHDALAADGLEDAYEPGRLMGSFAEETARAHQVGREAMDAYAIRSLERALTAQASGAFDREIFAVDVTGRKGTERIDRDEQPGRADPARIPTLKPAFARDGAITAANASSISDGAAALVLTRASVAERLGLNPVARIVAHAAHAQAPDKFATAPGPAMRRALDRAGWTAAQVDLFEVNEAFAVVAMLAARELDIPDEKLNVNGGACALGHPIGASGARILATLVAALQARGGRRGLASLCIGGGEATAMAVELL